MRLPVDLTVHHNENLEDSRALKPNESPKWVKSYLCVWLDNLGDFKYNCEALLLLAQKQMVYSFHLENNLSWG